MQYRKRPHGEEQISAIGLGMAKGRTGTCGFLEGEAKELGR